MNLLVVAGEPSGDRALATIVRALDPERRVHAFGVGGDALAATGVELLAHTRDLAALGVVEVIERASPIVRALSDLVRRVRAQSIDVALLASWSAANARIGRWLRRRGVPVAWVSPPEIWAWGGWRARSLARCADRLLLTLPFEEPAWRAAGADATYVGHPALDVALPSRDEARRRLSLSSHKPALALLPGSRPAEIARLAHSFAHAARSLDVDARFLVAPSLAASSRAHLAALGLPLLDVPPDDGALALLPAFDAALVASGTASLECALARVPPVVAYRMHPLTFSLARRLVRIDHVALPNVVLARSDRSPAFAELLQDEVTPESLARAIESTLENKGKVDACAQVEEAMRAPLDATSTFARRCAAIVTHLARSRR